MKAAARFTADFAGRFRIGEVLQLGDGSFEVWVSDDRHNTAARVLVTRDRTEAFARGRSWADGLTAEVTA